MQRAMLRWCVENDAEFEPRTAHHFINWAGALALAACVTDADYNAVAECFEHSNLIILGEQK
jgi:hypothetical protein